MSADRISTTGQIVLDSEVIEQNLTGGNQTTRIWTGSKANCLAKRSAEYSLGATMTKLESTQDGNYKLTVGFNYDTSSNSSTVDKPINAHELEFTMDQVDVYNSEVLRAQLFASFSSWAGVGGATTFIKGKVEQWDALTTHDSAAITTIESAFDIYSGAQKTLMLNLFRGIAYHQIKTAPQFNPIYRRRITAASYGQVQAAFTGVGKIWTPAEINSFENVPSSWWFALPTDKVWFKAAPSVNTIAGQKTEICYNYIASAYAWNGIHSAYGSASLISF